MIKSILNPKVVYNSLSDTFFGDQTLAAEVYSINICDDLIVAFGAINSDNEHNVIYFYIYLVKNDKSVERVGLFELEYDKYHTHINNIDELIVIIKDNNIQPILYTNTTCDNVKNKKFNIENIDDLDDSTTDALISPQSNKMYWNPVIKKNTIPPEEFWVNKLNIIKDKNYKVIYNRGAGDCFFFAIEDALNSLTRDSRKYTVLSLRKIIADNFTPDNYEAYRAISLVNDGTKVNEEYIGWNEFYKRYGKTFDSFQKGILTSHYYIDEFGLNILEKELNVKFLIVGQLTGERIKTQNPIVDCGETIDNKGQFSPDYYIMFNLENVHYELVTYNDQAIFSFYHIPKAFKDLIFDFCVKGGIKSRFSQIYDFKNYNK